MRKVFASMTAVSMAAAVMLAGCGSNSSDKKTTTAASTKATEAATEDDYTKNLEQYPQFQTAIDQLHDSAPAYAGALLSVFPEARQIVETEIENMINDKQTPQEAVDQMADQINKAIEDYNTLNE